MNPAQEGDSSINPGEFSTFPWGREIDFSDSNLEESTDMTSVSELSDEEMEDYPSEGDDEELDDYGQDEIEDQEVPIVPPIEDQEIPIMSPPSEDPTNQQQDEADASHAEGSQQDAYDVPPAKGRHAGDVTAYLPSQRHWSLENLPDILYRLKRAGYEDPDYRLVEDWMDPNTGETKPDPMRPGDNFKVFRNLPTTLSSKVEGWRLEAFCREDSRIRLADLQARIVCTGRRPSANALQMRKKRFREQYRMQAWNPRNSTKWWDDQVEKDLSEAQLDSNTTRGLQPYSISEVHDIRAERRGIFPERHGKQRRGPHNLRAWLGRASDAERTYPIRGFADSDDLNHNIVSEYESGNRGHFGQPRGAYLNSRSATGWERPGRSRREERARKRRRLRQQRGEESLRGPFDTDTSDSDTDTSVASTPELLPRDRNPIRARIPEDVDDLDINGSTLPGARLEASTRIQRQNVNPYERRPHHRRRHVGQTFHPHGGMTWDTNWQDGHQHGHEQALMPFQSDTPWPYGVGPGGLPSTHTEAAPPPHGYEPNSQIGPFGNSPQFPSTQNPIEDCPMPFQHFFSQPNVDDSYHMWLAQYGTDRYRRYLASCTADMNSLPYNFNQWVRRMSYTTWRRECDDAYSVYASNNTPGPSRTVAPGTSVGPNDVSQSFGIRRPTSSLPQATNPHQPLGLEQIQVREVGNSTSSSSQDQGGPFLGHPRTRSHEFRPDNDARGVVLNSRLSAAEESYASTLPFSDYQGLGSHSGHSRGSGSVPSGSTQPAVNEATQPENEQGTPQLDIAVGEVGVMPEPEEPREDLMEEVIRSFPEAPESSEQAQPS